MRSRLLEHELRQTRSLSLSPSLSLAPSLLWRSIICRKEEAEEWDEEVKHCFMHEAVASLKESLCQSSRFTRSVALLEQSLESAQGGIVLPAVVQ